MHKPAVDVMTEKTCINLVTQQDVKGMELKFIQFVLISYHLFKIVCMLMNIIFLNIYILFKTNNSSFFKVIQNYKCLMSVKCLFKEFVMLKW